MKVINILIFSLLTGISLPVHSGDKTTINGGNSEFKIVEENGYYYWKRKYNVFHIEMASLKIGNSSPGLYNILIREEHITRSHIGIEGTKSSIKLSAWTLHEKKIGDKLWVIESEADYWKLDNKEIVFIKFGCCDSPDVISKYKVNDGTRIN